MNILFITQDLPESTGGGLVSTTVEDALDQAAHNLGHDLYSYKIHKYNSAFDKFYWQFRGYTAGLKKTDVLRIMNFIDSKNIELIVYNTSKYGKLIKVLKKASPNVKHIVFFHNAEFKFVLDAIRKTKNPLGLITLFSTWLNERVSVQSPNRIITLNERDSNDLQKLYKRKADYVCPLSLRDRFEYNKLEKPNYIVGSFIGSNFYANNHGVKWFAEHVSPYINVKVQVIGKDFENEKEFFDKYPNMQLIGTVDSIDEYYYNSSFIVAPIFCGSGMKTKTAEAMMFGKSIFGTTESFEGYNVNYEKIGGICNTAEDFISAINSISPDSYYNEYSRVTYLKYYSHVNIINLFSSIIKSFDNTIKHD